MEHTDSCFHACSHASQNSHLLPRERKKDESKELYVMHRHFKLSKFKHSPITASVLTANVNKFRLEIRRFYVSKMDSVREAAKAWSNPGISSIYEKTRPNYNLDAVEFLLEKVGALKLHQGPEPFTIVELGAGTGKCTRAVLKVFEKHAVKNFKIISTEPLEAMCEKFKEMVPDVEILQCAASDLNGMCNKGLVTSIRPLNMPLQRGSNLIIFPFYPKLASKTYV